MNKEVAEEVLVQEQLIDTIITKKLKKFESIQCMLLILQAIAIVIFTITVFKEREFILDISERIKNIVDLLLSIY